MPESVLRWSGQAIGARRLITRDTDCLDKVDRTTAVASSEVMPELLSPLELLPEIFVLLIFAQQTTGLWNIRIIHSEFQCLNLKCRHSCPQPSLDAKLRG